MLTSSGIIIPSNLNLIGDSYMSVNKFRNNLGKLALSSSYSSSMYVCYIIYMLRILIIETWVLSAVDFDRFLPVFFCDENVYFYLIFD